MKIELSHDDIQVILDMLSLELCCGEEGQIATIEHLEALQQTLEDERVGE